MIFRIYIEKEGRFFWEWSVYDSSKGFLTGNVGRGLAISERRARAKADKKARRHALKESRKRNYVYDFEAAS